MRAGSLSDARVVAALRKYFVSVHVPMLSTADLIADPADRALLRKANGGRGERGAFWGGVREAFFAPDGALLKVFSLLYPGRWGDSQLVRRVRAKPDAAVAKWFAQAGGVLARVHGSAPDDWAALAKGTAPEVAAVAKREVVVARPPGDVALRVWVRNDNLMYEGLVGADWCVLTHAEARALLPVDGTERAWPAALVRRLGRASYPKGAVLLALGDDSITGAITTRVTAVSETHVHGVFAGRLRLEAKTDAERGRRPNARSFRWAACRIDGAFTWDKKRARFTRFTLAGRDGQVNYQLFASKLERDPDRLPAIVKASDHKSVSPEKYGTQPYALAARLIPPK